MSIEEYIEQECWDYDEVTKDMVRYDEDKDDKDQQYVALTKIIVPTEFDKEQLIKAFKYIHNLHSIDTDFMAINTIAHLYLNPDTIEVVKNETSQVG